MAKNSLLYAGLIIASALILAISSSISDSLVVDEVPHIGAGYSYVMRHDMRLNPEHPPLVKYLAGLPLYFLNLNQQAFETMPWTKDVNGQWEFGRKLIFNSDNNADSIKYFARLPMLLFFIGAAVLVFLVASRLYGDLGGLLALLIFVFSPTVIAHSRLVTTDVPALFGVLLATFFFIRYLKKPSWHFLIGAGITLGIALLTKFSTFLLIPYFFILFHIHYFFIDSRQHSLVLQNYLNHLLKYLAVVATAFIFGVWPFYYLVTYDYPPALQKYQTQDILRSSDNPIVANTLIWLADKPVIRALGQYGLGLVMVSQRASGGNTTYFLGEVSRFGWKSYFPIVYFLKEPLAWWGIVSIALMFVIFQLRQILYKSRHTGFFNGISDVLNLLFTQHFEESAMFIWLAIYWFVSIRSNLNIGIRHLLPIYGFSIILVTGQVVGALNMSLEKHLKIFKYLAISIAVFLGWYIYESISIYPYYLTYFNQVAGGASGGYRYVVDSNLDWGQDLIRLNRWLEQNNITKIELDYFGWADQAYYLKDKFAWLTPSKYKDAQDFVKRNDSNGWLAVSATFLQGSTGSTDQPNATNYLWLKDYEPLAVIGHSIFVYHLP